MSQIDKGMTFLEDAWEALRSREFCLENFRRWREKVPSDSPQGKSFFTYQYHKAEVNICIGFSSFPSMNRSDLLWFDNSLQTNITSSLGFLYALS